MTDETAKQVQDRMNAPLNIVYCRACRWIDDPDVHPNDYTCKAYPEGVPQDFAYALLLHDKPYPGDNGITLEPAEGEEDFIRVVRDMFAKKKSE